MGRTGRVLLGIGTVVVIVFALVIILYDFQYRKPSQSSSVLSVAKTNDKKKNAPPKAQGTQTTETPIADNKRGPAVTILDSLDIEIYEQFRAAQKRLDFPVLYPSYIPEGFIIWEEVRAGSNAYNGSDARLSAYFVRRSDISTEQNPEIMKTKFFQEFPWIAVAEGLVDPGDGVDRHEELIIGGHRAFFDEKRLDAIAVWPITKNGKSYTGRYIVETSGLPKEEFIRIVEGMRDLDERSIK